MKIFKNPIFTFIIGAIIFSSITAIAVTQINANQVSYTDSNNREIKLDKALDEVYANLGTKMAINTFGTALINSSYGDRIANRTASQQLPKGKYIVVDLKGINFQSNVHPTNVGEAPSDINYKNLSCSNSNSCVISLITSYYGLIRATELSNSYYDHNVYFAYVYYVEVVDNTTTISSYINDGVTTFNPEYDTIIAIPIN